MLDTNVLSELLRPAPEPAVLAWFAAQPSETLFVTAVTQAEMMLGARLLPAGRRRKALEDAVQGMFDEDFAGRILPFDSVVVPEDVDIVSRRRAAGRFRSSMRRSPPLRGATGSDSRHAVPATSRNARGP